MIADKIQSLTTEELCRMGEQWIAKALKNDAHSLSLHIPAECDDYDVLFTEIIHRLRAKIDPMDAIRNEALNKTTKPDLP